MAKKAPHDAGDRGTRDERPDADAPPSSLIARRSPLKKKSYKKTLHALQVELVKLQRQVIADGLRVLVILEGRDASGKDGTIKRITKHMSPRETRVVALAAPSDREKHSWYFQRYVPHLPAAGEIVFFNRSWYNRAGVEPVMGYCTPEEHRLFLETVESFEALLIKSGITLLKYYLDITREEQRERLHDRTKSPLTQWKISPVDAQALDLFDAYSAARDEMLTHTHSVVAPWNVVDANDKRAARLGLIRDILSRIPYDDRDERLTLPDPGVVMLFDKELIREGVLAR